MGIKSIQYDWLYDKEYDIYFSSSSEHELTDKKELALNLNPFPFKGLIKWLLNQTYPEYKFDWKREVRLMGFNIDAGKNTFIK